MSNNIENFVSIEEIAILGASPSGKKFGNTIYRELKKKGYRVVPVHPTADTIEGDKAHKDLKSLPNNIEAAVIAIAPDKAFNIVDDASRGGIKRIWFQSGANFSKAAEKAKSAGIDVVTGKCILMYAQPVKGVHAVHRFLARLFGRL
jgi:predicted CoA-binding protein